MNGINPIKRMTFFCVLLLVLAGCRGPTPPVQFFALNSALPQSDRTEEIYRSDGLTIGLGPLDLPQYLDRAQIVTRTGPNSLEVNEFHRWAGTLEDEFLRVLTENLSALTGTDRIELYPFRGDFEPDCSVKLKVLAFEGSLGDSVRLHCIWTLSRARGSDAATFSTSVVEPAPGGMDSLVAAQSRVLGKLSGQIANEISNLR